MPEKKPYTEEELRAQMGPGFQKASELPTDDESRRRNELLPMFSHLYEIATGGRPEGMGLTCKLTLGDLSAEITFTPAPVRSGGWGGRQQQTVFDAKKVEEIVAEYPDKLKLTTEGGKVQVSSDKYPGEDAVAKLKATGMRWNGAAKRWEQP